MSIDPDLALSGSTEEEARAFAAFVRHLAQQASALEDMISRTEQRVHEVGGRSEELCETGAARLAHLYERVLAVRKELHDQVNELCERSAAAARAIGESAQALCASVETTVHAVEALGPQATRSAAAVDGLERDSAAGFEALATGRSGAGEHLRGAAAACEHELTQVVDDRCHGLIEAHRQLAQDYDHGCEEGTQRVLLDGTRELETHAVHAAGAIRQSLEEGAEQFSHAVSASLETLCREQTAQAEHLRVTAERVCQAVDSAAASLRHLTDGFSTSARTLLDTMSETEIGLKVTVGSLQKVERLFKEIQS